LPRHPETPPLPFSGVDFLRLTFLVEAIVVGWLAVVAWRPRPVPSEERLQPPHRTDPPFDLSHSQATWLLLFITLVAFALRSYHLGNDLWLDEISPIVDYGRMPFVQVIGSYLRTNNHLLNTLLTKDFDWGVWRERYGRFEFRQCCLASRQSLSSTGSHVSH
jgi:hypothetical protein